LYPTFRSRFHYPTVLQISRELVIVAYSAQHTSDSKDGIHIAVVTLAESPVGATRLGIETIPVSTMNTFVRLLTLANRSSHCPSRVDCRGGSQELQDAKLSASSTHPDCSAESAALYGPTSWCASTLDTNQWLQVSAQAAHP
jgi:hypothetical protein